MEKYLYLLPLKDNSLFKIGISSNNLNRVKMHDSTYGIIKNDCLIITAKKSGVISAIERELLEIFEQPSHKYKGLDGWTELRGIENFNEALDIIKSKHPALGIEIAKLKFPEAAKIDKPKNIKTKHKASEFFNLETWNDIIKFHKNFSVLSNYILDIRLMKDANGNETDFGFEIDVHNDFLSKGIDLDGFVINVKTKSFSGAYGLRNVNRVVPSGIHGSIMTFDFFFNVKESNVDIGNQEKFTGIRNRIKTFDASKLDLALLSA